MSKSKPGFAIALSAALLFGAPSAASIKIAEYSGKIHSGIDALGIFGQAGQDMTGMTYVSTYKYDPSLASERDGDGIQFDSITGGGFFGLGNILLDQSFTTNGVTKHVLGNFEAQIYTSTGTGLFHITYDYFNDGTTESYNLIQNCAFFDHGEYVEGGPGSLEANVAAVGTFCTGGNSDYGDGFLTFETFDLSSGSSKYTQFIFESALIYSVRSAVPEPAGWAMMITGFGLIGSALRRRRMVTLAA